ncbi:MAG TPA: hypothetical protein VGU22_16260 [Methylomirabilota bacterium]|jgi:hypothetical protein|nr:hypothetical protein [Methylomirabilota bacterium]
MRKAWLLTLSLAALLPLAAVAEDSLVGFEGGIGVIPVSSVAGAQNANGTFPDVNRNTVRGTPPGGQPWVISRLSADVELDGRVSVDGRGLLLAGGNSIGTNGGQSVRASLFCGPAATATAHSSGLVLLEPNGDFRIEDILTPMPPDPCVSPVLLIVSGGGNWFAAGIPKD